MGKRISDMDPASALTGSEAMEVSQASLGGDLDSRQLTLDVLRAWLQRRLSPPIQVGGTAATVTAAWIGEVVNLTADSDQVITLPEDLTESLQPGAQGVFLVTGDGVPTFKTEGDDKLISFHDLFSAAGKGTWVTWYKAAPGVWVLGGQLA